METDPRYPIGKYVAKEDPTPHDVAGYILQIEAAPGKVEAAITKLTEEQLNTPYRNGGWTVRQVVHHLADSHLNAYVRVKWVLTEDSPLIKAYDEKTWALTPETKGDPSISIALLKALHKKWVALLRGLTPIELHRDFIHPETGKSVRLDRMIGLYAWHGEHHLAHIESLKTRMGW